MRKLRLFNGRAISHEWRGWHTNIAAYSKADAARLLYEAGQYRSVSNALYEVNNYFSECWGTAMEKAIPMPERGVYMSKEPDTSKIKKIA